MTSRLQVPRLGRLTGTVRVPGDKSISHRALIFSALADGKSRITRFLPSLDCRSTAACLVRLGVRLEWHGATTVVVHGRGFDGLREPEDVLDAGNSGTTMRLLAGLLAGRPFHSILTGDDSLRKRPMARVAGPLGLMGCGIRGREGGRFAPLSIAGGRLHGIRYVLPVASAQVKSCLMLAGLQARGVTRLLEPSPTRDHSERMLTCMGAPVTVNQGEIRLRACSKLAPLNLAVPGDISSALFLVVAATLIPGSRLTIADVGLNPTRTAALDVLKRMGATLESKPLEERGGEPVGRIQVTGSPLRATRIAGAEVPGLIDEIPILAVAATQAAGRTVIRDAGELRVKESDRIAVVVEELSRMGARIRALPDGMIIDGPTPLHGAVCSSHGDHRIGMALYVAAQVARGHTTILDPGAMDVSFPGFDGLMRRLGK